MLCQPYWDDCDGLHRRVESNQVGHSLRQVLAIVEARDEDYLGVDLDA
jgi:hypothetical protein